MALDPTSKSVNLIRSAKKFWKDGITAYPIHFDASFSVEKAPPQWIGVKISDEFIGQISNALMIAYLHSRQDREGVVLTTMKDAVLSLFENGYFNLYNTEVTPWVKIGGVLIDYINITDEEDNLPSETKIKIVSTVIRWSAVW